jgi:hypothetical protein
MKFYRVKQGKDPGCPLGEFAYFDKNELVEVREQSDYGLRVLVDGLVDGEDIPIDVRLEAAEELLRRWGHAKWGDVTLWMWDSLETARALLREARKSDG